MKRYWFYGEMPSKTVTEEELSEHQKQIIETEHQKLTQENYQDSWLGFRNGDGWDFMRHGFEVIHIAEYKSNIARQKFITEINKKKESLISFSE